MGTALSRTADLSTNKYLTRFVGNEHISPNDPFWNGFLTFNLILPKTSEDQLALDTRIEPFCQHLLNHNLTSCNLGCLIQVFVTRASELLSATNTEDTLFSWQTFNALFILRCALKYLTEILSEPQLIEHLEVGSNLAASRLETLLGALLGILVDVPLRDFTYALHLEAITTLIVLLSVQTKSTDSIIYRLMMRGRHAIHAPLLVKSLLRHFIEQRIPPVSFFGPEGNHQSIVFGFAANLWSLLTFNKTDGADAPSNNDGSVEGAAPLATQSLLLLLVLTNHCTTQANPYRQSLFTCANDRDSGPIGPGNSLPLFKVDYEALFVTLSRQADKDAATLLLYLLVHRNVTFRQYLLDRVDLERLVIPILRTLYNAPNSNSHHIYMSLIVLLILSEDDSFNKNIHSTKLKAISWYSERALSEVSLGGLLVLVVIRTVQYNMSKMRDKYLHTNCLAALANMSGQFRELHPYVSQRLVSLFESLARRYRKLQQMANETAHLRNGGADETVVTIPTPHDQESNEIDLGVLEEVLRMVLEIFNSCLSNRLVNNPNLVYTLLYKRDVFEPFRANVSFQDVVRNIEVVIEHFSQQLSDKAQQHEVDFHQVLCVIQQGAKSWPKDKLTKFPDLKFKYVEEEQPEEFFIPYVWSLVSHHSLVHCNSAADSSFLHTVC